MSSFRQRQSRIERAKARLQKMESEQKASTRKRETRQLILTGRMTQRLMEKGKIDPREFMREMDRFLTRNQDRELFGLSMLEEKPSSRKKSTNPGKQAPQARVGQQVGCVTNEPPVKEQQQPAVREHRPIHVRRGEHPAHAHPAAKAVTNGRQLTEVSIDPSDFLQ